MLINDYLRICLFLLYLLFSYAAFAPFFVEQHGKSITPGSLFLGACFGVMSTGLIYILLIRFGSPNTSAAIASTASVGTIGAIQIARYKQALFPDFRNFDSRTALIYIALFLSYGGLVLVATLKMGQGDFPPLFFNTDTPLRLAQAHALVSSNIYPPESLMIKGMTHAYHYGAPATVAVLSKMFLFPVHKTMFWIVTPLFLIGGFMAIIQITHKLVQAPLSRIFGILLFLPLFLIGQYALESILNLEFWRFLATSLVGSISGQEYNSRKFMGGVPDLSVIFGIFLLLASALLIVLPDKNSKPILGVLIAVLAVTFKMDHAPAVCAAVGISLLLSWGQIRNVAFFAGLLGLFSAPLFLLIVSGYGGDSDETNMITLRSPEEIAQAFHFSWGGTRTIFKELLIGCLIFALVLAHWVANRKHVVFSSNFRVALLALGMMITAYSFSVAFFIPKVSNQFAVPVWAGTPLIVVAFLGLKLGKIQNFLRVILLTPLLGAAILAHWSKLHDMSVAVVLPEFVDEYADNRLIGDALSRIPTTTEDWIYSSYVLRNRDLREHLGESADAKSMAKFGRIHYLSHGANEGRPLLDSAFFHDYVYRYPDLLSAFERNTKDEAIEAWGQRHYDSYGRIANRILVPKPLVVTNDFGYLQWKHSQPQIPALFGHQAYGVHLRHFPGPSGVNVEGQRKIYHQLRLLTQLSGEKPDIVKQTKSDAFTHGWTHFLFRKDRNDESPLITVDDIPLKKLYENSRYAVFEF